MSIVSILVALLLVCVLFWAARALMTAFDIKDPIATVVYVVLVVLVIAWAFGGSGLSLGSLRLTR